MKNCAEYECSFLRAHELTIHSKSLQQVIFIFSIYQISEKQFSRDLIGFLKSEYPWLFCVCVCVCVGGGGGVGGGPREIRGRERYGRREKKGREAGSLRRQESGEKFKKAINDPQLILGMEWHSVTELLHVAAFTFWNRILNISLQFM